MYENRADVQDAFDSATRESGPAEDAADSDALSKLDEAFRNAGNVLDIDSRKSKAPPPTIDFSETDFSSLKTPEVTEDGDVAPAPPSQRPSS